MISVFCGRGEKTYDISNVIKNVSVKGEISKACRELTLDISGEITGLPYLKEGACILFKVEDKEVFQGFVFSVGNSKGEDLKVKCYDMGIYLKKNKQTYKFNNKKASDIIKIICTDFSIPMGEVDDSGFNIKTLILENKTLFDSIKSAIEMTFKQTGKKYRLFSRMGKIFFKEIDTPKQAIIIEEGANLISIDYTTSIDDLKNRVKLVKEVSKDNDDDVKSDNKELQEQFGVLQYFEKVKENVNKAQMNERADKLLKEKSKKKEEVRLKALGNIEVSSGEIIFISSPAIDTEGYFKVVQDDHTFNNGEHMMSLKVERSDINDD